MEKKTFNKEFKEEAVRLVVEQGLNIKQAATELGVSYSAMGKWVRESKRQGAAAFPGSGNLGAEDKERQKLKKRIRELEMERDILKKATAFFAKESQRDTSLFAQTAAHGQLRSCAVYSK